MIEVIDFKKPEDTQKACVHVDSKSFKRAIYAEEIASLHIDDLRTLFHEMESDRDSMIYSIQVFARKLAMPPGSSTNSHEHVNRKLAQLNRKLSVYETFLKLIKQEISWRLALHSVARAKLVIQAKEAGLSERQINVLLNPETAIHFTSDSEHAGGSSDSSSAVAGRIEFLKENMVAHELCAAMAKEFDDPELQAMKLEARQKVDSAIDWANLALIFFKGTLGDGTIKL